MQGNRLQVRSHELRTKARVVLDSRFPFTKTLDIGDTGQLDSIVEVTSTALRQDEYGDDRLHYTLEIKKAEIINNNEKRL